MCTVLTNSLRVRLIREVQGGIFLFSGQIG
jgi:hypothetical protein